MSASSIITTIIGKMILTTERMACGREYKVRDISQADFGRLQIQLAELEMPGLMACRSQFGPSQPLRGTKITGCLHLTAPAAVLVETLTALGASVRWCSSDAFSTEDHVAAAVARDSAGVFAWKGQSPRDAEYWWSVDKALDWGLQGGPDFLIDDAGDATLFIHEGVRAEEEPQRCEKLLANPLLLEVVRAAVKENPKRFSKTKERVVGVSIQTSSGIRRLLRLQDDGTLLFPAINVSGTAAATSQLDDIHGVHQSVLDGLMRALDRVTLVGKVAVVVGYGNVGKGCAMGLKGVGARVIVSESNPLRALQAIMDGFSVRNFENVVSEGDIFITATGNRNVITVQHMQRMKNNAVVGNLGQFENEIDFKGLTNFPGIKRTTIKPLLTDRFVFQEYCNKSIIVLAEGRTFNFASAPGQPSFVRSLSFTTHVIALLELLVERKSCKYQRKLYLLPRQLDEKVARLHLAQLGAELTQLTSQQATYVVSPVVGLYINLDG